MNKIKSIFLTFIIISLFFLFISFSNLEAKKKSITCYYDPTPPTIDGWIYKVEWDGASPANPISLYGPDEDCDGVADGKTDESFADVRYEWDFDYIYILITIYDVSTGNDDDIIGFCFQTNHSAPFVELGSELRAPININKGNDVKLFYIQNNYTVDAFTTGIGLNVTNDVTASGSEDSYGRCSIDDSGLTDSLVIEMKFALNITDNNGCDVTLPESNLLNMTIFYDTGSSSCTYTQYCIEEEEFEYIELILFESTRPMGYSWIFASIVLPSIISAVVVLRRRKTN